VIRPPAPSNSVGRFLTQPHVRSAVLLVGALHPPARSSPISSGLRGLRGGSVPGYLWRREKCLPEDLDRHEQANARKDADQRACSSLPMAGRGHNMSTQTAPWAGSAGGGQGCSLAGTGVDSAAEAVICSLWSSEALTPRTLAVRATRMEWFASFVRSQGVQHLDEVPPELVVAFIDSRRSSGARATDSERSTRLFSVRRLYREARMLGLAYSDPTVDISLPRLHHTSARPLTDEEIEVGRSFAIRDADTTPAVCWGLAETSARTSEIPCLRTSDLDLIAGSVWIHGGRSTDPRPGTLTPWGTIQLARRLRSIGPDEGPDALLIRDGGWRGREEAQNAATCVLRSVLKAAGLAARGVNPMSIAAWAGARALTSGASIEAVARMLGVRSLDQAAAMVRFDWRAEVAR
jgi:site-specific recombinase XerC